MLKHLEKRKKDGLIDFIKLPNRGEYLIYNFGKGYSDITKWNGKTKEDYMYGQYANINRIDKYKNKYKQFEYGLNDIGIYNTIEEYTIWKNISDFMYKYEI